MTVVLPKDPAKRPSPEYLPVTVWVPAGVLLDVHLPWLLPLAVDVVPAVKGRGLSVRVQSRIGPTAKVTVPVGATAPDAAATVAE